CIRDRTKCVCIEFEIDDNKVLLSDFDGWHFVLSNGYYDQSGSEDEAELFNNKTPKHLIK
ncbi:DUF3841 domain-containing protein, partial [[Clostridium] symbiosum]